MAAGPPPPIPVPQPLPGPPTFQGVPTLYPPTLQVIESPIPPALRPAPTGEFIDFAEKTGAPEPVAWRL